MLNSETAGIFMVSSLINSQNYSWVVIILREVFVEESCKAVIPIRRTPKPLKLMQLGSKNGSFSIKLAYRVVKLINPIIQDVLGGGICGTWKGHETL